MLDIVVTGGSGFIGSALLRLLAQFPDQYRARAASVRGDALEALDLSGVDCVVHAAGIAHVSPSPQMRPLYEAVNRDLAVACARRARAAGVRHFVLLSSAIVFGEAAPAPDTREIAPDTPPAPAGAYGLSKLEAERGVRALEDESFRVAVVRPMMVFGPGCKGNYNRLSRLTRRFPVFPKVANRRGAVYIDDLVELLRRLIDQRASGAFHPQTFVVSTTDFARAVARAHNRRLLVLPAPRPLLRLAGRAGVVRRALGGFCYREDMAARGLCEGALRFDECVARTEEGHG